MSTPRKPIGQQITLLEKSAPENASATTRQDFTYKKLDGLHSRDTNFGQSDVSEDAKKQLVEFCLQRWRRW